MERREKSNKVEVIDDFEETVLSLSDEKVVFLKDDCVVF